MDRPRNYHTKSNKNKYHMISFTCRICTKSNKLIYKTEIDTQTSKINFGYQRGKVEGKDGFWGLGLPYGDCGIWNDCSKGNCCIAERTLPNIL